MATDSISVICSKCKHAMKFSPDKAGKKGKCSKCQTPYTIPAASTLAPIKLAEEDGPQEYGVTFEDVEKEKARKYEEERQEKLRKREASKKKGPKLKRKFNPLPEKEAWEKVQLGLLFIMLGCILWALSHGIRGLWLVMGNVEGAEYARHVIDQISDRKTPFPVVQGLMWDFDPLNFYVGIISGRNFTNLGRSCVLASLVLYFVQSFLWMIGYILLLSVPNRWGSKGQVVFQMVLWLLNLVQVIVLHLLPMVGVIRYYMLPLLFPEICLTEYNMERTLPMMVLFGRFPFLETYGAVLLHFLLVLQPIVGCLFLQTVGRYIRDKRTEDGGESTSVLGFGTYFAYLAYILLAVCGTSPVLINVLRVVYTIWFCFHMMFIIRYMLVAARGRAVLNDKLNPTGITLEEQEGGKKKKKGRRDDDDDDDDDDD